MKQGYVLNLEYKKRPYRNKVGDETPQLLSL